MNNDSKSYKLLLGMAIVLVLVIALITGCTGKGASSDNVVSEIAMSKSVSADSRPIDPATVFATDTRALYLSFKVSNFPVGTNLQVEWIYLGGDPEAEALAGKNYVAETQTATITKKGEGYTYTTYSRDVPGYETWPKGDYKVVISADGVEKAVTYFKIQ
ncbi:MAG: hypothetical protein MUO89_04560 [Dehalococcoidia bacterium]|nr:hypothetical protein [Dehalococcoidia bacterium]